MAVNPSSKDKSAPKKRGEIFRLLNLILEVGFTMALSILVFVFAGSYLDKRMGYKSFFTIIGIFIGIGGGFYNTYRLLKKYDG